MPRKPEGPRAMTTAECQARQRGRRTAGTLQLRMLVDEALDVLERLAVHGHTASACSRIGEQDVGICRLCGGCHEHRPECIIYRADHARGWQRPMSSVTTRGVQRVASVPVRIVEVHGRWYGHWYDSHHGTGHHVVGPCATPRITQQCIRKDIQLCLGAHVRVIVETTH